MFSPLTGRPTCRAFVSRVRSRCRRTITRFERAAINGNGGGRALRRGCGADVGIGLALAAAAAPGRAHTSLPDYFEFNEIAPGTFSVVWRVPSVKGPPPL